MGLYYFTRGAEPMLSTQVRVKGQKSQEFCFEHAFHNPPNGNFSPGFLPQGSGKRGTGVIPLVPCIYNQAGRAHPDNAPSPYFRHLLQQIPGTFLLGGVLYLKRGQIIDTGSSVGRPRTFQVKSSHHKINYGAIPVTETGVNIHRARE